MPFQPQWIVLLLWWIIRLIVLPGYLLAYLLWRSQTDRFEQIGYSFALGFTFFSILGLVSYSFTWSPDLLLGAVTASTVVLFIAALWVTYKNKSVNSEETAANKPKSIDRHVAAAIITVSLAGLVIALGAGWYPRGDAAFHLQYIRKIITQDQITQPHTSLVSRQIAASKVYDSYYLLLAMISHYSRLDPTVTWHYLSGVLSLLVPFVIYPLLTSLKATKKQFLNSMFFLLLFGIFCFHGTIFNCMVYPNRAYLWLLFPVAMALFFRYLNDGGKLCIFVASLVTVSQLLLHPNGFLFYYWIIGGIMLVGCIIQKNWVLIVRRGSFVLAVTTLVASPLLWLKLSRYQAVIKKVSSLLWHKYYNFWYLSERLYAFRPGIKSLDMFLGLVIAAVAVYQVRRCKSSAAPVMELFIGASFLVPFAVIYNPLAVPIAGKYLTYTAVGRMSRLPAFYLAFACGLEILFSIYGTVFKKARIVTIMKGITYSGIFCAYLVVVVIAPANPMMASKWNPDFSHSALPIVNVLPHLTPDSLVMGNNQTGSDIAMFHDVYVVGMKDTGPVDINAGPPEVSQVLSGTVSLEQTNQILEKYTVDYIVIDKEFDSPGKLFEDNPDVFHSVYSNDRYDAYQVFISPANQ